MEVVANDMKAPIYVQTCLYLVYRYPGAPDVSQYGWIAVFDYSTYVCHQWYLYQVFWPTSVALE